MWINKITQPSSLMDLILFNYLTRWNLWKHMGNAYYKGSAIDTQKTNKMI